MKFEVNVLIRRPEFPVIIVFDTALFTAYNFKELSEMLFTFYNSKKIDKIIFVDSQFNEFWFQNVNKSFLIVPGFLSKKWTKKGIIEILENVCNILYGKNISNVTVTKFMNEICLLIDKN